MDAKLDIEDLYELLKVYYDEDIEERNLEDKRKIAYEVTKQIQGDGEKCQACVCFRFEQGWYALKKYIEDNMAGGVHKSYVIAQMEALEQAIFDIDNIT